MAITPPQAPSAPPTQDDDPLAEFRKRTAAQSTPAPSKTDDDPLATFRAKRVSSAAPTGGDINLAQPFKAEEPPEMPTRIVAGAPPSPAAKASADKFRLRFGGTPATVATDETGASVVVGRPKGIALPKAEIDRLVTDPNLATKITSRLALTRSPKGYVHEKEAPDFANLATSTFLDAMASPFIGAVGEQSTEQSMAEYAKGGGKFEPWQANLLGAMAAGGSVAGNVAVGKALGAGSGMGKSGEEAVASRIPGSTKAARQLGARLGTSDLIGMESEPAVRAAGSAPIGAANDALRSGALKAIEDVANANNVHPSKVAELVAKSTAAFRARAPMLREAGEAAAGQAAGGAVLGGVSAVAQGERDPARIAMEMGKSAAEFGVMGGAFHALGAEAQFRTGYDIMKRSLEHAPELHESLASERMARADNANASGAVVPLENRGGAAEAPSGEPVAPKPAAPEGVSPMPPVKTPEQQRFEDNAAASLLEAMPNRGGNGRAPRDAFDAPKDVTSEHIPPAEQKPTNPREQNPEQKQKAADFSEPRAYVPESSGFHVTEEQMLVRNIARGLKVAHPDAIAHAAPEMAERVPKDAVLVPLPDHTGSTAANEQLATAIADLTGSEVLPIVRRKARTLSSMELRQAGKPGLTAEQHAESMDVSKAPGELPKGRPVVFIDNVETTGATAEGARRVLGVPDAQLVTYAKAPIPTGEQAATAKTKHDYSSTQVDLPPETAKKITDLGARIPDADLAADGRETTPHITVKYGLHTNEASKIRELLKDQAPIAVTLGKTSLFENDDADVVKVDVDSPELHALNKKIADALPHTDTHPDYTPHATVAYVKPGLGKKYAGDTSLDGHEITLNSLTFSNRDGEAVEIPLSGTAAAKGTAHKGEDTHEPLTVYHGTTAGPFKKFRLGTAKGWGTGIYFTDNQKQAAEEFGHAGRVVSARVNLRNPYNPDKHRITTETIESTKAWKEVEGRYQTSHDAWEEDGEFVTAVLRELGYDGVVADGSNSIQGKEVVAFHPDQVEILDDGTTPKESAEGSATDPLSRFDTPAVLEARKYSAETPSTHTIDTPERRDFRDRIVADEYGAGARVQGKEFTFLLGLPGSGKSTIAHSVADKSGALLTDADRIKEKLPEYAGGKGALAVHRESVALRDRVRDLGIAHGDNLVVQTLGLYPDDLTKQIEALAAAGWKVHLKFADLPSEQAAERSNRRFEAGGHFIDPAYILSNGEVPRQTFDRLKGHPGVTSYERYDTDVPRGEQPRLIESGQHAERQRGGSAVAGGGQGGVKGIDGQPAGRVAGRGEAVNAGRSAPKAVSDAAPERTKPTGSAERPAVVERGGGERLSRAADAASRPAQESRASEAGTAPGAKTEGVNANAGDEPQVVPDAAVAETFDPSKNSIVAEQPQAGDDASSDEPTTGIKNIVSATTRESLGMGKRVRPEPRTQQEMYDVGKAVADADPTAIPRLLTELRDNPERIVGTASEAGLLLKHRVDLDRRLNEMLAAKDAAVAAGDEAAERLARLQLANHRESIKEFVELVERTGTASGRALAARKMMSKLDYSLSHMEAMAEAAKGERLTTPELERIKALHDELVVKLSAAEADLTAANERAAIAEAELHHAQLRAVAMKPLMDRVSSQLGSAADAAKARIRARGLRAMAGMDPEELADHAIVGAEALARGILRFADWSQSMKATFGDRITPHLKELFDASNTRLNAELKRARALESRRKAADAKNGEAGEPGAEEKAKPAKTPKARTPDSPAPEPREPVDIREKLKARLDDGAAMRELRPYLRQLALEHIRNGIVEREAVLDALYQDVLQTGASVTRAQTRDALSGYGDFRPLDKSADKAKLREIQGEAQKLAQLEALQRGEAPRATGFERGAPSDEARRLAKQVNDAKKAAGLLHGVDDANRLKSALDAAKTRTRNAIADLRTEIDTGERIVAGKHAVIGDAELNALRAELAELRKIEADVFKSEGISDEERLARAMRAAKRSADMWQERLEQARQGAFSGRKRPARLTGDPELEAIRAKADVARREFQEFQALSAPPKEIHPLRRPAAPAAGGVDGLDGIERTEDGVSLGEGQAEPADADPLADLTAKASPDIKKGSKDQHPDEVQRQRELLDNRRYRRILAQREADLLDRLARNDYSPRVLPAGTQYDKETLRRKAEVEEVKQRFQAKLRDFEKANRTPLEKARDAGLAFVRAGVLSWPTVIVKLTSVALSRVVTSPLTDLAALGVSNALPRLAAGAPRYGARSARVALHAEAAAQVGMWTEGMVDAGRMLLNKQSRLALLHDKQKLPHEWYEYFGSLHAALKEPVKRAEYARALYRGTVEAMERGENTTDDFVKLRLSTEAYLHAERAVAMNDNAIVSAWNQGLHRLEQKDKATGKANPLGVFLATVLRAEMPIVKAPTNVILDASEFIAGLPLGSARAAWAYAKGIEDLKPVERDSIIRMMAKGLVGMALMALYFYKHDQVEFGGFYQAGEKRTPDDVPADAARVGSTTIPKTLLHNPLFMAGQFAASIARVAPTRLHRRDEDPVGYGNALVAASVGLVEQIPIVGGLMKDAEHVFDPKQRDDFLAKKAASLVVPGVVQWLAKQTDTTDAPRKATGLVQNVEANVPRLRLRVPVDEKKQRKMERLSLK